MTQSFTKPDFIVYENSRQTKIFKGSCLSDNEGAFKTKTKQFSSVIELSDDHQHE